MKNDDMFGVPGDATGPSQAVAALRESEGRFRRIADSAPVPMWVTLSDGARGFVNRAYTDFLGVPYDDAIDFDWREIIHPDDHDRIVAESLAGEASLEPFVLEGRFMSGGEWRWLRSTSQPRLGPAGDHIGFIGVAHDVTDAKTAEAALRESETEFRALADNIPLLAWMADVDGDIYWYNRRWYEYTGMSAESQAGWGWESVHDPETLPTVVAEWRRSLATGEPFDRVFPLRGADGAYRSFLTRAVPIRDESGKISRWFGTNVDITSHRAVENALREASEQARQDSAEREAILQQLAEGVIVTDAQGRIGFVNAAAAAIHGIETLDVVPDGYSDAYQLLTEDGRPYPPLDLPLSRAVLKGQTITDARWRIRRPDGSEVLAIGSARPVLGPDRAITGAVLTLRDDTQRRAAEDALRELNETLEARVVAETNERLRAEDSLRQAQKMEAIGQLTGGIAHDFNNLLTVILNSVELLGRPGISDARRDRYVAAIGETAERAARLTSQLLSFARRQPLSSEAFDVCERLKGMETMLRTTLGSRITLMIEAGDVCCVEADSSQFDTALLNMAVNARDAMPAGGRLTLTVSETNDGKHVALRIADTGAGIAPEQLDSVFEPFFTTKSVGKGTGLGLSQVYGFAVQSRGDIAVESTPGEGSVFTLTLPHAPHRRSTDKRPDAGPAAPGAEAVPGTGRILVVEDNRDVGEFGGRLLEELGYSVVHAADARAALDRLATDDAPFDLVLSDVVMPGEMDGLALARHLARERPDLPVILTTGYAHALIEEPAHGFEVLRKPYSIGALSLLLHEVMGGRAR